MAESGPFPQVLGSKNSSDRVQQLAGRQRQKVTHQAAQREQLLSCQWTSCTEACPTAELLYDHVCEHHVGRKSTNNLTLVCAWGTCRTVTIKRDHITSHIRVHVPLKPHRCHFCGKTFKRPQDLKKHVKTHADNTDDLDFSEPSYDQRRSNTMYRIENGKVSQDLQSLEATATGYYAGSGQSQSGSLPSHDYGGPSANGNPSYYGGSQPNYGGVYYNVHASGGADQRNPQSTYDPRRRGYETLNEFFGDVKRHHIDPTSSRDVGQRLLALQGLQLPDSDYPMDDSTLMDLPNVSNGGGGGGGMVGPLLQPQYSLPPMHNLRTKTDLSDVDRFLEQMQSTVYESSNYVAAAGVNQPGAVFVGSIHGGHRELGQYPSSTLSAPMMASGSSHGTPVLTPPSSALSHTSAHSPSSMTGATNLSPLPLSSNGHGYPSLHANHSAHDLSMEDYSTVMATPMASLGPSYDDNQPRRYSGGMLQSAAPSLSSSEAANAIGDALSASTSKLAVTSPRRQAVPETEEVKISAFIDPNLSSEPDKFGGDLSPTASEAEMTKADQLQEMWVENIRVIEALRMYVRDRLQKGEYDDAQKAQKNNDDDDDDDERDSGPLYPALRVIAVTE